MSKPSEKSLKKIRAYVEKYADKVGLCPNPDVELLDTVVVGLAIHLDTLGKPLCPCRYYPDKAAAAADGEWLCPCKDMQKYKFCHCLLFVDENGSQVTNNLPPGHEGLPAT